MGTSHRTNQSIMRTFVFLAFATALSQAQVVAGDWSREGCEQAALAIGKTAGGCGFSFVGNYDTKGCYSYEPPSSYSSCVFYGTINGQDVSSLDQLTSPTGLQYRVYNHRTFSGVKGTPTAKGLSYNGKTALIVVGVVGVLGVLGAIIKKKVSSPTWQGIM